MSDKHLTDLLNKAADYAAEHQPVACSHGWSDWKEIGRTGDWFHPLIVERTCSKCGASETNEH